MNKKKVIKKKIFLLADTFDKYSFETTKIIVDSGLFEISGIIFSKKNNLKKIKHFLNLTKLNLKKYKIKIFNDGMPHKNNIIINYIKKNQIKLCICTGFKSRLRKNFISAFNQGVINFHPAALPFCKGAHSTFWTIIENRDIGSTMHLMSDKYDSGPILDQIKVKNSDLLTATEVFNISRKFSLKLLKRNLKNIYNYNFKFKKNLSGYYHSVKEINKLININIKLKSSNIHFWRLLRATSYKNNGIIFKIKNQKFKIISKILKINEVPFIKDSNI